MIGHRDLLQAWLRGGGYHINDIKAALDWYDAELAKGNKPDDQAVKKVAEDSHKSAVNTATGVISPPKAPSFWWGVLGGGSASILVEVVKWLSTL